MSTSVTTDPEHAVVVPSRNELANLLAATGLEIQELENERREFVSGINLRIKKLKTKFRDFCAQVEKSGVRDSFPRQMTLEESRKPNEDDDDHEN